MLLTYTSGNNYLPRPNELMYILYNGDHAQFNPISITEEYRNIVLNLHEIYSQHSRKYCKAQLMHAYLYCSRESVYK